ncbi:MAG: zinc-binding dehydrogenase [Fimbriimonadaceae bacterium]|nr:zinc-binding dehydrogenase [Fimbriimonadaceae bacterium]
MSERKYQAVQFTAREQASLVTRSSTTPLGPHEVEGPTICTLVSPGTELNHGYLGESFPYQCGYAAVFEIAAVGAEVSDLQVGQRVFAQTPHVGWTRARANAVVPVAADLGSEVAVFARLLGVTLTTVTTTKARPNSLVAVTGLGPVGHLAAQNFSAAGYRVIGVDPLASRRAWLAERCDCQVAERLDPSDPVLTTQLQLVVECSGHEAAVHDACATVRKGGEVVMVGVPWQRRGALPAHELLHLIFHRYVQLRSGWEWELPWHPREFTIGSILDNYLTALRWLHTGRVNVAGLAQVAAPADCQEVYQTLLHRPQESLVALFDWR